MAVDVSIRYLRGPANCCATLSDGTILVGYNDEIFEVNPDSLELRSLCRVGVSEWNFNVARLHRTSRGELIYASRNLDAIYFSDDRGRSFRRVYDKFGGTIRGLAESTEGRVYIGKYGQSGPAQLYASDDCITWSKFAEWSAKHIHDVRIDPITQILWVVVGEGDGKRTSESHAIYQLLPGSTTFVKVYGGGKHRPLFTAINFFKGRVIVGTDHPEGGNYIAELVEDGNGLYVERPLVNIPRAPENVRVKPFVYFIESYSDCLFVGVRGTRVSFLMATSDLQDWQILEMTSSSERSGISFITANCEADKGALVISGNPGLIIRRGQGLGDVGILCPTERSVLSTKEEADDMPPNETFDADVTHSVKTNAGSGKLGIIGQRRFTGWSLSDEEETRRALLEVDPRYETEISKGYFFRATPFFYNKLHLRESLVTLLEKGVARNAPILDYGCGTGQFLLYLAAHGFTNLHGWDQNQRWLTAGEQLFERLSRREYCSFSQKPREAIYDIAAEAQGGFAFIGMFGLIYGHGIDISRVFRAVYNALLPGGIFVANDSAHNRDEVCGLIAGSGLKLQRLLTDTNAQGVVTNQVYFCTRPA